MKYYPTWLAMFLMGLLLAACATPTAATTEHVEVPTASPDDPTTTPLPPAQTIDLGTLGKGVANDVAWSPDGKILAVLSSTGIHLYDSQNWQLIRSIQETDLDRQLQTALVFLPDGALMVNSVSYQPAKFRRYKWQDGQLQPWFEAPNQRLDDHPVFAPDGQTFAILATDCDPNGLNCTQTPELRQIADGKLIRRFEQDQPMQLYTMTDLLFSPDGRQLALARDDNLVQVWEISTGKLLYTLRHDSNVADLAYSPDGQTLASVSKDATARFWDTSTGQSRLVLRGFQSGLQSVAYIANGQKLLLGQLSDNNFLTYKIKDNLPTQKAESGWGPGPTLFEYYQADITTNLTTRLSPDARRLALLKNELLQVWDVTTGQLIQTLPEYSGYARDKLVTANGRWLAVADHTIQLWDIETRQWAASLPVNAQRIFALAIAPDGTELTLSTEGGWLETWSIPTRQRLRRIETECLPMRLAYSSDSQKIAAAGWCNLQVWDAKSQQVIFKADSRFSDPHWLAFHAGDSRLIVAGEKYLQDWDIATGTLHYETAAKPGEFFGDIQQSENLGLVDLARQTWQFFDPQTGQFIHTFARPKDLNWNGFALSPNGRLLAWADGSALTIQDAISGAPLLTTRAAINIFRLRFSADSRTLIVVGYEGILQLWDISTVLSQAAATPPQTATPQPVIATPSPTPTPTFAPVAGMLLQPQPLPSLPPNAISPGNLSQLEALREFGLGAAHEAAWSADGRALAVSTSAGVYLFPFGAQKPAQVYPATGFIVRLAFSPNGRLLAGQISNDHIQIWDLAAKTILYTLPDVGCWSYRLRFSPDNETLTALCGNETYQWRMSDGTLLNHIEQDDETAFSPDPQMQADSQSMEIFPTYNQPGVTPSRRTRLEVRMSYVQLLDAQSGEIIQVFDLPGMAPDMAGFSPDGKAVWVFFYEFEVARTGIYFPGGERKSLVQLWDLHPASQPTLRAILHTEKWYDQSMLTNDFRGLLFSPDSRRIFIATGGGQTQVWDVPTAKLLATIPNGQRLFLSADGRRLAVFGNKTQIWNVASGIAPSLAWEIQNMNMFYKPLALTPGGAWVSGDHGVFQFWQARQNQPARTISIPDQDVKKQAASPDGKWLAYSTLEKLVLGQSDPANPNWQTLSTFSALSGQGATILSFAPNSAILAAKDGDFKLALWHLDQETPQRIELESQASVDDLLFSPDSRLLLGTPYTSSNSNPIYLWDAATGKLLRQWQTTADLFAFHPNGATLAAADYYSGEIVIYDLRNWQSLENIPGPKNPYVLVISPNGQLLAVCNGGALQLWDTATQELLKTFPGSFNALRFAPDGQTLFASLSDGRIQVFGLP